METGFYKIGYKSNVLDLFCAMENGKDKILCENSS